MSFQLFVVDVSEQERQNHLQNIAHFSSKPPPLTKSPSRRVKKFCCARKKKNLDSFRARLQGLGKVQIVTLPGLLATTKQEACSKNSQRLRASDLFLVFALQLNSGGRWLRHMVARLIRSSKRSQSLPIRGVVLRVHQDVEHVVEGLK